LRFSKICRAISERLGRKVLAFLLIALCGRILTADYQQGEIKMISEEIFDYISVEELNQIMNGCFFTDVFGV
jgi:hypothetical protein